jgi:hypothetical protein
VAVWEGLMDSTTLILTANCETVYALAQLDLASAGPTVVEAPPHMPGVVEDALQRYLIDMRDKHVGHGSQYLWTYHDSGGGYLRGENTYRLHIEPDIPALNFWSVVVYDALSQSLVQASQPRPSASTYTDPVVNADGSIDIFF